MEIFLKKFISIYWHIWVKFIEAIHPKLLLHLLQFRHPITSDIGWVKIYVLSRTRGNVLMWWLDWKPCVAWRNSVYIVRWCFFREKRIKKLLVVLLIALHVTKLCILPKHFSIIIKKINRFYTLSIQSILRSPSRVASLS